LSIICDVYCVLAGGFFMLKKDRTEANPAG